jgi:beta-galactosidase
MNIINIMKRKIFTTICCLLVLNGFSQPADKYFDPAKMIETGVYYYPEAWDTAQWNRDFAKIAEMGFEFTHMAEFAWASLEPSEGKYDFAWLDKAVALAEKNGLKLIMCTPTPTPPVWLVRKYPEVLVVREDGIRADHGTREHYSWSSAKYRELTQKLVTEMAKHYANTKSIFGWQIDNEPSHYGIIDYGDEVKNHFQEWLKNKYQTIDKLNKAWGTIFWSGTYTAFEQIGLPSSKAQYSGQASPHSVLDFKRFNADECTAYIAFQSDILKKYISPAQFVTTNYMHAHTDVDPRRDAHLDFPTYTMYPVAGFTNGIGDQGFRLGDPWRISFANDMYRPIKGVTGVMELQPGQVNWGQYNPQPYPGVVRAWLWNSFAGNLRFVCSYRFRQPLSGLEQFHFGMVGTDGVTPLSGGKEYSQFIKEMRNLRKQYNPKAVNPAGYEALRTGYLYNLDNLWYTSIQRQTYQWNYETFTGKYYNTLKSLGAPVDFVSENNDFEKYKVLVAPAYQLVNPVLIEKWTKYVENGGHLVLTARSGYCDPNGQFYEAPWANAISKLIGGKLLFFDLMPADKWGSVALAKKSYQWNNWADIAEADAGTEVLSRYTDQYYAGKAAVLYHKLGKGSATFIGPDTDDGELEQDVMKMVYERAGLKPVVLPKGVMREYRNGFGIAINYNSKAQLFTLPANAKVILGEKIIKPAGVLVWTE